MERCYLSQSHRRPSTSDRWYYIPNPSLPSQNMSGHGTLNPLCIGYAFRPDLSSRLTWSGRTFLQKPEVSGHVDSHHIRATHSGILTSVNSTTAFAIVSPLTQRSPTPHTSVCSLSFGLYLSPVKFSAQRRSTSELLRTL